MTTTPGQRQKMKEYHERTYPQRREKKNAQTRERRKHTGYYEANKEEIKARTRAYYWAHQDEQKAKNRARDLARRKEVIEHYGGKCACCGEAEYKFLAIDHVNNDGANHRKAMGGRSGTKIYYWLKKNNCPPGFQVLCHNCNMAKGFYGMCPHQERKDNFGSHEA